MKIAHTPSPLFYSAVLAALALAQGACSTQPAPTSSAPVPSSPAPTTIAAAPAVVKPTPIVSAPAPVVAAPTPVIASIVATPKPVSVVGTIDYDKQIKPFFAEHCLRCHGATARVSAGVNLTTKRGLTIATKANLVYDLLTSSGSDHMPPRGNEQPTEADLAMVKQWLAEGGKFPDNLPAGI